MIPDPEQEDEANKELTAALAAFGLVAADPEALQVIDEEYWMWPENEAIFDFWRRIQTQWHVVAMVGATGLNYSGVEVCLRMAEVGEKDMQRYWRGVQAMESATLDEWSKRR